MRCEVFIRISLRDLFQMLGLNVVLEFILLIFSNVDMLLFTARSLRVKLRFSTVVF